MVSSGQTGYVLRKSSSEPGASHQSLAQTMYNVAAEFGTLYWDVDIYSLFSLSHPLSSMPTQHGLRTLLSLELQIYKSQLQNIS